MVKKIKLAIIGLCSIMLCGCGLTLAENWKRNAETGEMELIQQLKLKGLRDKEVKFEDKSELKDTSILKDLLPDIELDIEDFKP